MVRFNDKKGVIIISVIAFFVVTSVILYLSLSDYGAVSKKADTEVASLDSAASPGENNREVKAEQKPEDVHGRYEEAHDGWFYDFQHSPSEGTHGTFSAGYNQNHKAVADNPEKDYTQQGTWHLENGEIKLYSESGYIKSLLSCGDYVVDTQNYFVGKVPEDRENFQSAFISKAGYSGDTQILNFYSDGKMIMEIIRDDGEIDSSAESSAESDASSENKLPPYQAFAGKYTLDGDKIVVSFFDDAGKTFYIVDDGIAGWVYNKV